MIKLILKGEEEGTTVVTDKMNALSRIIDCMQKNEVHEITVEYKTIEKGMSLTDYVETMKNNYLSK